MGSDGNESDGRGGERKESEGQNTEGEPYRYFEAGGSISFSLMFSVGFATPLPSNRHHRRCGDRLEGKGENYQVCSVQYCVQQLCTVRCTHI